MKRLLTIAMTVITIALFASSAVAYELPNLTEVVMKSVANTLDVEIVGDIVRTEIPTAEGVVAHYTAILKVGPYKYDKIGIHRVVKEKIPGWPVKTDDGILCSGGDVNNFNLIYMPSTIVPPGLVDTEHSLGIYLAKNGLDVWGIDWRWATIPVNDPPIPTDTDPGITHLDTSTHLDDFELSLKFARRTRLLTGQGFDKLFLTGFSRGAYMAISYADKEAAAPQWTRLVKGIIPVDFPYKSNVDVVKMMGCEQAKNYDLIKAGSGGMYPPLNDPNLIPPFFDPEGGILVQSAYLAMVNPGGDSDIFVGLSNKNVYDVLLGGFWFPFTLVAGGPALPWHFFAVEPIDILPADYPYNPYNPLLPFPVVYPETTTIYSDYDYVQMAAMTAPPYQSYGEKQDSMVVLCDGLDPEVGDSPYDDNLSEVTIPVLYVGTDGAFALMGPDILTELGSSDTGYLPLTGEHIYPYSTSGYGHADPYFADDAETTFWQPMLEWIQAR